ncbi:MAG: hypothetical protein ACUVXJ_17860 [Phycisphaerae bacterium]
MVITPEIVRQLVEKFRTNADHYTSPTYNETLCRVDFINPMFEALGWDVANRAGYAEAYRDVIHEDAIKVGGPTETFKPSRTQRPIAVLDPACRSWSRPCVARMSSGTALRMRIAGSTMLPAPGRKL